MNKSELIDRIAEKTETSKAAAARMFDALFDSTSGAIAEAVQAGKQVSIPGFGKFRSKERGARKGRNPQTGAEIHIPASTVISFAPAKGLREAVRSGKAKGAPRSPTGSAKPSASGGAAAKSSIPKSTSVGSSASRGKGGGGKGSGTSGKK